MRVGLVGLGNMGQPMAARMRAAGLPLAVHDLRADHAREVAEAIDATVAPSLAALAASSDVVVTMLPDGGAVRDATLGPGDRLLDGLVPGAILVDMTRALFTTCGRNILPAPKRSPTTFIPAISGPSMTSMGWPPRPSISSRSSSVSVSA